MTDSTIRFAVMPALALAACAPAGPAPRAAADPSAVVQAEREFAAAAASVGVPTAFARFADDSSVAFHPDPVNAKAWWRAQPADPKATGLSWYPVDAEIAASGEMGFTSGPWVARDSAGQVRGSGEYSTVWRRGADGWHWVVDQGAPHAAVAQPVAAWSGEVMRARQAAPAGESAEAARASLLAADSAFARDAASLGFAAALERHAADAVRMLRPGHLPAVGRAAAVAAAREDAARRYTSAPLDARVAASRDFGWSYGTYEYLHPGAGRRERGHYVRVWTRDGAGPWRVRLDVVGPRPGERDE